MAAVRDGSRFQESIAGDGLPNVVAVDLRGFLYPFDAAFLSAQGVIEDPDTLGTGLPTQGHQFRHDLRMGVRGVFRPAGKAHIGFDDHILALLHMARHAAQKADGGPGGAV
jgi:hypothetical protein